MGTWGDGLYDNDSVLDTLADVVETLPLEKSEVHFIVGLGVVLWMEASAIEANPERFRALLERRRPWIDAAPVVARQRLLAMLEDPETFAGRSGDRPEPLTEVLGGYCNGPREDALLLIPGANDVLEELAEECRSRLDGLASDDLYEIAGELAPLGVLLELTQLGIQTPKGRVAGWRRAFEAANDATKEERDFFDAYVARVRKGFALLGG